MFPILNDIIDDSFSFNQFIKKLIIFLKIFIIYILDTLNLIKYNTY